MKPVAFYGIVTALAMPVGMSVFGPLSNVYSVQAVLVASGIATFIAAALAIALPAGRRAMQAARDHTSPSQSVSEQATLAPPSAQDS